MYHSIIRRKIRQSFGLLNTGNYEAVLTQFAPDVYFTFAGEHALGGEQHSVDGVRQWFQRLYNFFPDLQFEIHTILVSGWPWNTVAATHFTIRSHPQPGRLYENTGVQILRIKWGRIVEDHLYEDTQKLAIELSGRARKDKDIDDVLTASSNETIA